MKGVAYLLDTCTLLWALEESASLGPKAREVLESHPEVYVSPVNAWEIQVKWMRGNLHFDSPPRTWWTAKMEEFGFEELPLRAGATFLLGGLPDIHKDPFDRILVCQALDRGLTLITPDPQLLRYPVPILW